MHAIKTFFQLPSFRAGVAPRFLAVPLLLLGFPSSAFSQAVPTATRPADIQVGVGFLGGRPGYQPQNFYGFGLYADLDPRTHWGLEAGLRQISGPDQSRQRTFEVGGRYFRTYGALAPYAKGMYGRGTFRYPFGFTERSYNLLAGGAGVDLKATRYIHARIEYEYQDWLGFSNGGLHPQLITIGVAYHFEGRPRYNNR